MRKQTVRFSRRFPCAARVICLLLACLTITYCCTSCGDSDKTNVNIKICSILGSDEDLSIYSEVIADYTKEHSNVIINGVTTDKSGSYKMELSLASTYQSSDAPDIVYYSYISDMSELSDYFVTIDEIREDYPDFASSVSEAALNSVAADDGGRYCIPIRADWQGIIVNAALFRKNSLTVPESWEDIIDAADFFQDKSIYLFANPLDDSNSLLEYLVRGTGGIDSVYSAINGSADSSWTVALEIINRLDELGAFPSMSEGAFDYLISDSDIKNTSEQDIDPIELYNSGQAAALLIDSSMCGEIDTDIDSVFIELPAVEMEQIEAVSASDIVSSSDSDDAQTSSETGLYVDFSEGFYITKKAYYNDDKREELLELIEYILDDDNCIKFCNSYQAPALSSLSDEASDSLTQKSNIYNAVIDSVQSAQTFLLTTQTSENTFFWNHCSVAVSYMSKGLLSVSQTVELISDTQLTVADVYTSS